jgi:hypothetical protein
LGYSTVTNRNKCLFQKSNKFLFDKPKDGIWVI